MIELRNGCDVLDAIVEAKMDHDIRCCKYQEDVYLYIDDNGTGSIEIFVNVGGNSWIDDDHITVCCMKEYLGDWTDTFETEDAIASVLDCSCEHLIESVREWLEATTGDQYEQDEIKYNDVYDYVRAHQPILDKIMDAREYVIRYECKNDYYQWAEEVLRDTEGVSIDESYRVYVKRP